MSDLKESLKEFWELVFVKSWPVWVAGIILGVLNILLFLVKSPWSGTAAYVNWGQNAYQFLGIMDTPRLKGVFEYRYAILGVMTILGAAVSALMARDFSIKIGTVADLVKGFIGGVLMALGATIGLGCTIGGFFSGWSALSGGAIFTALGLLIGSIVGLRILIWEMNRPSPLGQTKRFVFFNVKKKSSLIQPVLGTIMLFGALTFSSIYFGANGVLTWFAIFGLLIGFVCQKSQFCIVRAFREPFMTGMSEATTGVLTGLVISLVGFTVIKYMGIGTNGVVEARQLAMTYVFPNFWLRALIGGVIFGVGMLLASGCAVGVLWRVGEGHVKLWLAALGFLITAPLSKKFVVPGVVKIIPEWGKEKFFLPDYFGYAGSVVIFLLLIFLFYLFAIWNERNEKFTMF